MFKVHVFHNSIGFEYARISRYLLPQSPLPGPSCHGLCHVPLHVLPLSLMFINLKTKGFFQFGDFTSQIIECYANY